MCQIAARLYAETNGTVNAIYICFALWKVRQNGMADGVKQTIRLITEAYHAEK